MSGHVPNALLACAICREALLPTDTIVVSSIGLAHVDCKSDAEREAQSTRASDHYDYNRAIGA